ncbi:MAG: hypothetical protein AAF961_15405, partial [Planctomycetota bacterium]
AGAGATADLDDPQESAFALVWQQAIQRAFYMLIATVFSVVILTFIAIMIVPSFQEIYADFGLELPGSTKAFFEIVEATLYLVAPVAALVAAAIIMIAMLVAASLIFEWRIVGWFLDRVLVTRHQAHVFRLLADAVSQGVGIDVAFSKLTGSWSAYPSALIRRRLAAAEGDVDAGAPWPGALQRARLATASDVATLGSAEQVGNVPWALRMLADRKLQLQAFRWSSFQQIAFAAFAVGFGACVLCTAVALIAPLVQLPLDLAS